MKTDWRTLSKCNPIFTVRKYKLGNFVYQLYWRKFKREPHGARAGMWHKVPYQAPTQRKIKICEKYTCTLRNHKGSNSCSMASHEQWAKCRPCMLASKTEVTREMYLYNLTLHLHTLSFRPKWRCGNMCRQGDKSVTFDGRILNSPFFVFPMEYTKKSFKINLIVITFILMVILIIMWMIFFSLMSIHW